MKPASREKKMGTSPEGRGGQTTEMGVSLHLVVFGLDGQRYALALDAVERIIRAVEVTPLPGAPAMVLGVIDMEGSILPVFNLRRRFLLPEREIGLDDQILIARATMRRVALVIDEAKGVVEHAVTEITGSASILPSLDLIQGVVQLEDGLVLIHDLEKFLSLEETRALDEALHGAEGC